MWLSCIMIAVLLNITGWFTMYYTPLKVCRLRMNGCPCSLVTGCGSTGSILFSWWLHYEWYLTIRGTLWLLFIKYIINMTITIPACFIVGTHGSTWYGDDATKARSEESKRPGRRARNKGREWHVWTEGWHQPMGEKGGKGERESRGEEGPRVSFID